MPRPQSIAILGASNNRNKFGNKAVRAFHAEGYLVYPINPHERNIEGLPAYQSIRDLPARPDMISVYLHPEVTLTLLNDIAAKGCNEFWLNPGAESEELVDAAQRVGLNVIQACSLVGKGVEA